MSSEGPRGGAAGRPSRAATVVLEVGALRFGSEAPVVERAIGQQPGVIAVEANPSAQTATVTFDPKQTSVAALRRWVQEYGYHGAGQSVPLQRAGAPVSK